MLYEVITGKFGARDIRKVIRKEVEDKVASIIIDSAGANLAGIQLTANEEDIEINAI